jgi:hypothetical protein
VKAAVGWVEAAIAQFVKEASESTQIGSFTCQVQIAPVRITPFNHLPRRRNQVRPLAREEVRTRRRREPPIEKQANITTWAETIQR